ncbi:MAG: hypothetical protein HQL30_00405, partial [Candidatus Omnitrophica bacterium]|nr:hypothetical protein [Candidatus Omnitrophota bacterium]
MRDSGDSSDTLAPASGLSTLVQYIPDIQANLEKLDITDDLKRSFAFMYISAIIGDVLAFSDNKMSGERLIEHIRENLPANFKDAGALGFHWEDIVAERDGCYCLRIYYQGSQITTVIRYYDPKDQRAGLFYGENSVPLGVGDVRVHCEKVEERYNGATANSEPAHHMKENGAPDIDNDARAFIRELIGDPEPYDYSSGMAEVTLDDLGELVARRIKFVEGYKSASENPEYLGDDQLDIDILFSDMNRQSNMKEWLEQHHVDGLPVRFRVAFGKTAIGWDGSRSHAAIAHAGRRDRAIYIGYHLLVRIMDDESITLRRAVLDEDEYRHIAEQDFSDENDPGYARRLEIVRKAIDEIENGTKAYVDGDFLAHIGFTGEKFSKLLNRLGRSKIGQEYILNKLLSPSVDHRDILNAYAAQEEFLKKKEGADKVYNSILNAERLIEQATRGIREFDHSQSSYDKLTETFNRLFGPGSGEFEVMLYELDKTLNGFDLPCVINLKNTLRRLIDQYQSIFPADSPIFRLVRYDGGRFSDFTYSSAPDLQEKQKKFISVLKEGLGEVASNIMFSRLRTDKRYKSAVFNKDAKLFSMKNAVNPALKLRGEFKPVSLDIDENFKVTVFSGLNTGGKSVLIKTAASIALMVQAGMPVPADVEMNGTMFNSFVKPTVSSYDIGAGRDSRFSAELRETRECLRKWDVSGGFVIVDDDMFGGSTEPQTAGSCFNAFVEELKGRGSVVLGVTHHLRALEALQDEDPDIRFLKVKTEKKGSGEIGSTREFVEGIAGSSHGMLETMRLGWPAADKAVRYFNELAAEHGYDGVEYRRMEIGAALEFRRRSQFCLAEERDEIEVLNIKEGTLFSREMSEKVGNPREDPWGDYNDTSVIKSMVSTYMSAAIGYQVEPEREAFRSSVEGLKNDPSLFKELEDSIMENLKFQWARVTGGPLGSEWGKIQTGKDMEGAFNEFIDLAAKCDLEVLNNSARDIKAFLATVGGTLFLKTVKEKGLIRALYALAVDRSEQTKKLMNDIGAIFTVYSFAQLLKRDQRWSLAEISHERGNVKITGGWHTGIDKTNDKNDKYLPIPVYNNADIHPDGEKGSLTVFTGFNTGGKSTMAKMIAQIVYFARMGWPVPAAYAKVSGFSDIQVLSQGVVDALERQKPWRKRGKQGEEDKGGLERLLKVTGQLIQNAGPGSLVILDEPFSGATEPSVSAALTAGLAEALVDKGATVILITHLLDVVPSLCKSVPGARAFQAEVGREIDGSKYAKYSFVDGIADSSQGLEVARNMEWP